MMKWVIEIKSLGLEASVEQYNNAVMSPASTTRSQEPLDQIHSELSQYPVL